MATPSATTAWTGTPSITISTFLPTTGIRWPSASVKVAWRVVNRCPKGRPGARTLFAAFRSDGSRTVARSGSSSGGSTSFLPPFAELTARREAGPYGGRILPFLALPDLIRSKETERHGDWDDIAVLEEFLDARLLAEVKSGTTALVSALARLRSRRGLESYLRENLLSDPARVGEALQQTSLSVTQAYLLPWVPREMALPTPSVAIEPLILRRLRQEQPGSPLHLALVEVVRRQYKLARQAADRADKEVLRAAQRTPPASPS